ncbi:MAG: NYN domain-containing protein, partial [Actinomycetota bacterium]|nr:NYN domain-containing protein [Actinomycetota bacterium]
PQPATRPEPTVDAPTAPPTRATRPRRPRRVPVPLPPGVLDDSVEAADHLVRVPGMTLLVDGYNASLSVWPELTIAEQRRRLVDALAELAARSGVDASVVFDGADTAWPAAWPAGPRQVKVSFSPADVEADDVILERVAALDPSRRVLVASSDRRVRDGAAALGANVISSAQLLGALRR